MEYIPKNRTNILVVDDDEGLLLSIKTTLVRAGLPEPAIVSDPRRVLDLVREHRFHLILLDLIMPHIDGMEILKQLKEEFVGIECIIVTAVDDLPSAVRAMKYGAYDYLVKPLNSERLLIVIHHALERYNMRHGLALYMERQSFTELKHPEAFAGILSEDRAMARVFHQVEMVAPTDYSVIITGESGTGKEMVARALHRLSGNPDGPFVAVNMAAFSRHLFEDDFFGHTRGAYTGAVRDKKGFFEEAQGGTLFLDEITELDPPLQVKLLRVIQERELYRLGSTEAQNVDVRIIAATNRDISAEIRDGGFRADLYYRLNRFQINIPPLRERSADILPLARHFLARHGERNNKDIRAISREVSERLLTYDYPGNVRELENIISSLVLMESGTELSMQATMGFGAPFQADGTDNDDNLMTLAEQERQHIRRILEITEGNRTQAAKILGIGLRTLHRKMKTYQLAEG